MVRQKRIRKFKLKLLAAAGIFLLAAVLLTAAIIVFKVLHSSGESASEEAAFIDSSEGSGGTTGNQSADSYLNGHEGSGEESEGIVYGDGSSGFLPEGAEGDYLDDGGEELPEELEDLSEALSSEEAHEIHGDDDSSQDQNSSVSGDAVQFGRPEKVYLTFDDGPSIYTGKILDILKEYGVHATFFVCGTGDRDERLRPLYRRIVEEGHTLGMHSYSHVYSEVYSSVEAFQDDLDKIRNLIYNEAGVAPKYYRFPGGSGNTVSSLPISMFIPILYSQGIEYYDWNVYSGDASSKSPNRAVIARNTLDGVDRTQTAVVLLHDTGAKRTTVEALPEILSGLKERNLEVLPFDNDTPPLHQFVMAEGE